MVEDRGTQFCLEMDSFSRRRLKYNFLVRKLRTTCLQASRFDRRLFGCNNDSFESKSIESFERKNIFLNRIERKILNMRGKERNLSIRSEFRLISIFYNCSRQRYEI